MMRIDRQLRSRLIRLAHTDPELRPHLLPILAAAQKAKTPAGAKELHRRYLNTLVDPSKSTKKVQDFYDPKGGKDPDPESYQQEREKGEKAEKETGKTEKGEEKTKERAEESKRKFEKPTPKNFIERERKYDIEKMRGNMSKGREMAKKDLEKLTPKQIKKKVEDIVTGYDLDPDSPDAVQKALDKAQRWIDDTKVRATTRYSEGYYTAYKTREKDITNGYAQALLSKYKKQKGDKGEKAKRKTKVTDLAKKHELDEGDASAIRDFTKKKNKQLTESKKKKKDDKTFLDWYWHTWQDKSDEDETRYKEIAKGFGNESQRRTQSFAQMKAEFLKGADPEMKKRVEKMSPADFQAMMAAIMDEEDIEVGAKQATLRGTLIRLAHARPEMRPYLLPLIKESRARE